MSSGPRLPSCSSRLVSGRAGPQPVLPTARQLVEELPGSERRAQLLARGLYLCGDQSQALATLRALRRALRDEGLDAAPSVGELEQAILSHDARLDPGHQADRAAVWEQPALPSRWGAEAPVLVGRQRDVDDLGEAWASAARGARRTVLVGGDAGAGKSRLVAEVATSYHSAGAVVLLGHCSPDLDRPYQPFIEPLQRLVEAAATGDLVLPARIRAETIGRATLVAGGTAAQADVEVGSIARDQLYDAVVQLVHAAARIRPVVLVLEDLHWAGAATLELFEHLVSEAADDRLLVLATHRNTQPDRSSRVAATMSRLGRLDGVQTLDLEPLTVGDIEEYVIRELRAAPAQARQAGALLREQSAGNAFFLREIVRDLVRNGGLAALGTRQVSTPNVIRDTYESRLAQLGPEDRRCLEIASVVGQEFDVDVVAAAGGIGSDRVLHAVDSGVALGVVDARPSAGGRFGFVHEIARQTVQQLMSPGSVITTHLMVAEALRDGFPNAPDRTERLAYHFAAAQSLGRRDEAQRYLREAARLATARLAHADAASFLERAIELARTESEAERASARGVGSPQTLG